MLQPRLLSLAAALLTLSTAWAAETPSAAPTAGGTPTVEAPKSATGDAKELLAELPAVPEVVQHGTGVEWQGDGASAPIVAVDPDTSDPELGTDIGPVHVPRHLVEDHHVEILPVLPALVARAKAAHLAGAQLTIQVGLLTGPSLRDKDEIVILPDGVLRKQALTAPDRSGEIAALGKAAAALTAALPSTGLDEIGRHALQEVIHKLDQTDGGQALDEIAPSFARREVHHGYLRQWFRTPQGQQLVAQAEQAVDRADAVEPVSHSAGDGLSSDEVRDAFGARAWILATPHGVSYAYEEPQPEYLGNIGKLIVAVDLPTGADPSKDAAKATAARIFDGNANLLASWSAKDGFHTDLNRWRDAISISGRALVKEAIPPHILIRSLSGDVAGLAVEKGLLKPAAGPSHGDSETFLHDAARLLPDNAHLDLVGEYLFAYVYPSPDAKYPDLMGNRQMKSNVQQTVWQTCGNVAGGIMHGDCADIAELYQTLTTLQGLNPIIIGLPEHAACCWAEKQNDAWHVSVLQTGPPLEFFDKLLPDALEKAYKLFDPSMPFDANELPLLLRFSGESSRSEWSLSWRIFSEPAYCKTMIEVERDWQYETYQRGISTMQAMIKGGDDDNANYRELCGLYAFTGQYDLAAEYCRKARDRTDNTMSKMSLTIQLAGHLLNAGHTQEAIEAVTDVLDKQLPPLKERLGPATTMQIALELTGVCLNEEGGPAIKPLALKTMSQELIQPMGAVIDRLAAYVASPDFSKDRWDNDPDAHALRSLTGMYAGLGIELLHQEGPKATDPSLQALRTSLEHYFQGVAFYDLEDSSAVMEKEDFVGRWWGLVVGQEQLDAALDRVSPAKDAKVDFLHRTSGKEQMEKDLPFIRASVPYWYGRLADLYRRDKEHLDPKQVARITAYLAEAERATVALGLTNPRYLSQAILGQELQALTAHDLPGLRAVLHRVAENNDKALRDDAAQWLGDAARFCDLAWYRQVLDAWRTEVDYKPKYYWIAWRAALNKAPQQALMVAKLAAERFKDDPAFVEEYGFMRATLAAAAKVQVPAAASSGSAP